MSYDGEEMPQEPGAISGEVLNSSLDAQLGSGEREGLARSQSVSREFIHGIIHSGGRQKRRGR